MLFLWEILTNHVMTRFPGMHHGEKVQAAYTDTQQVARGTALDPQTAFTRATAGRQLAA